MKMFKNVPEKICDKVYDWLTCTYYSPYPVWKSNITDERERAIHALNDMRALYAGVGNNGWWEEDRVAHLEDLRDICSYSMNQVLWHNEQIRRYNAKHEQAREEWEYNEGDDTWGDEQDREFFDKNAPEIIKMQFEKGKLYELAHELFWDSVEWFMDNYATDDEKNELDEILKTGVKLYSLLEKASHDFRPEHFTDEDLANAKKLVALLNPRQLFDGNIAFNIGQPTKLTDGTIKFGILQNTTDQRLNVFLMIKPDGKIYW